jgi:aspartyl protease family protein
MGFTVAAWGGLLALLAWLAQDFLEAERNPNSVPRVQASPDGRREVVLMRNRTGHYLATGTINGYSATFLVDTGATLVAVDEQMAAKLGLAKGARRRMQTANGIADGWQTLIGSLELGGLVQHSVPAVIMPRLGEEVLLGMSYLKRIELVQRDGFMILRGGN